MWHYARGRALAATGDVTGATGELERLRALAAGDATRGMRMEFNGSADLLGLAEHVLAGSIEAAAGRFDPAVEHLREAVRREDRLLYGEPPEWTVPARQDLGAVLLQAGRHQEAERVFREELARFPDNGWSLSGLASAVRAQGRESEAATLDATLRRVWETADVQVSAGAVRAGSRSSGRE
jgi:Flp pilus assembly protein TadD